jgi:hypothetical protein
MNIIPLFKSQYSIGKSILTLEKAESSQDDGPDSIIDICLKNNLKSFFLIDDSMSGFLQGYVNSKESGIKMIFGLRLTVCEDIEVKNEQSLNSSCKYVIVAKNNNGYKRLIKIYSKASTEGFYYVPRIDFNNLSKMWDDKDLQLVIPFYDSFIHRNYLEDCLCPPPPSKFKIDFIKEDNSLPFDDIISEKIDKYIEFSPSGSNCQTVNGQSIYYKRKKDFKAYLTFRAIDKRTTLGKPNLEHMASDEFCLESWIEKEGLPPNSPDEHESKSKKPDKKPEVNEAEQLGKQRQDAHPKGTKRYYSDPNKEDVIGVAGEIAFANRYDLEVDKRILPEGDGHIDFTVKINGKNRTIDVKTAQLPYNLFIKEWEINKCADILVLAQHKDGNIKFLGWETKKVMQKMPKKVFSSLNITNYYKKASELRSMEELDKLILKK